MEGSFTDRKEGKDRKESEAKLRANTVDASERVRYPTVGMEILSEIYTVRDYFTSACGFASFPTSIHVILPYGIMILTLLLPRCRVLYFPKRLKMPLENDYLTPCLNRFCPSYPEWWEI